nr:hypothetical protein [Tanacetum cinerariifolium]
AKGCWEVIVEVVGCSRSGESGGKWKEKGLQEWRETLCNAQCFKRSTGRDGTIVDFT